MNRDQILEVKKAISEVIVGQEELIEALIMGVLTGGHILLEGVPGLAKTLSVSSLSKLLDLQFQRVQFTPDLLPTDLIGTMVFNPKTGEFYPKKGPVFSQILLADEINRASAKVQSALLEAMAEKQVTIGEKTYLLKEPFLVLATQNPLEQEGTYRLPEAQLDRFMFQVLVSYPNKKQELLIMERMSRGVIPKLKAVLDEKAILNLQEEVKKVHLEEPLKNYIVDLVLATRNPEDYSLKQIKSLIHLGVSPRASIYLARSSRAYAFLQGKDYVSLEDIKTVAPLVLRHRLILSYEAQADKILADELIEKILNHIEVR